MQTLQQIQKEIIFDLSRESGFSPGFCFEHTTGGNCHCKENANQPSYRLVRKFNENHRVWFRGDIYEILGMYKPKGAVI